MRHFIAVGPKAGRGNTEEEAVSNMQRACNSQESYRYETFEVHPDTKIKGKKLSWPDGYPPISLGVTNSKVAPEHAGTQGGIAEYVQMLAPELVVPTFGFRGTPKQQSKPKVRVTEAEHTRILNLAAQMQNRGPVAPVLTGDEVKLRCAVDALKKIRKMGYASEVWRKQAAATVLAITRVAEAAIRTVGGDEQPRSESHTVVASDDGSAWNELQNARNKVRK